MKRLMIRYKVKPDRVAENEGLVHAVYAELKRENPAGFRYATFRLEDGFTFVHFTSIEMDGLHNPLLELKSFKQFTENIRDRCDEPPVSSELHEIGSFHFFGD